MSKLSLKSKFEYFAEIFLHIKFVLILDFSRTTPTTPAEKRKARRKSSLFQPKSESSTPGSLTNELLAANEDVLSSASDVTLGVISDFDISDDGLPPMESTKVDDSSKMNSTAGLLGLSDIESKENLEAEMTDEGASLNDTPKEFNLTEHPTTPLDETKKVTSVGSMRKNVNFIFIYSFLTLNHQGNGAKQSYNYSHFCCSTTNMWRVTELG